MKKVFLLFLVVLCHKSLAQEKHRVGVTFGPNYFDLRGSRVVDYQQAKFGSFVGLNYEYKVKEKLSLITGVIYESKNTELQYDYVLDPYIDVYSNIWPAEEFSLRTLNRYSYITLPVLVRYKFGNNNSFFINGGIFISAKQKHTAKATLTNNTKGVTEDIPAQSNNFLHSDRFNKTDTGLTIGFGKIFIISSKTELSLELRDYFGLKNQTPFSVYRTSLDDNIRTNTLSLATTFSVGL